MRAFAIGLLLLVACTRDLGVSDRKFGCASDGDCAGGHVCDPTFGFCVPPASATVCSVPDQCGDCVALSTRCFGEEEQQCTSDGRWAPPIACGEGRPTCTDRACPRITLPRSLANLFSCVVYDDAQVRCWGSRDGGAIGLLSSAALPTIVEALTDVRELALGQNHACAVTGDGRVSCWGDNRYGQANKMLDDRVTLPIVVPEVRDAKHISLGVEHSCALLGDRTVTCWGNGQDGQVGYAPRGPRMQPGAVTGLGDVVEIHTGTDRSCAIKSDGSVWCWGKNGVCGLFGLDPESETMPGGGRHNEPVEVPALRGRVKQLSLGDFHTCAVFEDDAAYCWGCNGEGQAGPGGDPTPITRVLDAPVGAIDTGFRSTCAIHGLGTLMCFGANHHGQIGNGVKGPAVLEPSLVPLGPRYAVQLTVQWEHVCVVTNDQELLCWGLNNDRQAGDQTMVDIVSPKPVIFTAP